MKSQLKRIREDHMSFSFEDHYPDLGLTYRDAAYDLENYLWSMIMGPISLPIRDILNEANN